MCGINGILRLSPAAPPVARDELLRTRDAMAARGPDGAGDWISPGEEVGLASRRLAVLDLSPAGAQPMASADGRYHIVHNGEIYNFRELKRQLIQAGVRFRSEGDTELLVELYAREGLAMMPRLRGMYAFAIWDERRRELLLARDPYGIKPLYYTVQGGLLRFASQVRALSAGTAGAAGAGLSRAIEPAGLAGFLVWGAVPEPFTILREVRALPAGHMLAVSGDRETEPRPHPEPDHDEPSGAGDARRSGPLPRPLLPSTGEPALALEDSVKAHLVSDVPVGIFLSAGLDSALVAALARRHLSEPPATFTLVFESFHGTPSDEGPLAALVARTLGTRHTERQLSASELANLWPRALAAMDQPSVDGFNTYLVSHAAREAGLKVVLSGLGGDEIFGGYPSFRDVPRWSRAAALGRRVPGLARVWPHLAHRLSPSRPKLAGLLAGRGLPGSYTLRRGLFLPAELPGLLGPELAWEGLSAYSPVLDAGLHVSQDHAERPDPWLAVHRMESALYLRNQLLRDADWASMAHSLELRVPLVDAELTRRLAAQGFEPARSHGKAELVRRVAPELPAALFERRKSGFSLPPGWWEPAARQPSAPAPAAFNARRLALRVLEEFGVTIEPPPAAQSRRGWLAGAGARGAGREGSHP